MFFYDNTGNHNMDEGICPLTLEEFCVKAPKQMNLFYSQGSTRQAVYKESTLNSTQNTFLAKSTANLNA